MMARDHGLRGWNATVQPASRLVRAVLCTLVAFVPAWAVTLVHRPYLQNVRDTRATLVWSTRENVGGTVQYSTDQQFSLSAPIRTRAFQPAETKLSCNCTIYQHQADLFGLTPGTEYSYRVVMDGQNLTPEPEHRFRTAGPGPLSFLVLGDSGSGSANERAFVDPAMGPAPLLKERPNFVLHMGDIAYEEGTFQQFQDNYFDYYFSLMRRLPFFPAPGNHEYFTLRAKPYLDLHSLPAETVPADAIGRYYSFDWGSVHFVALDSNLMDNGFGFLGNEMLEWLEQDLSEATAPWRIVYFHHLPYPLDHHMSDPLSRAARERIVPILERHGVQLVLTGHEHAYERTKPMRGNNVVTSGQGTLYVTTGGAGGSGHEVAFPSFIAVAKSVFHYLRIEVTSSRITIHAIDKDGKEFDTAALTLPSLRSTPVAPGSTGPVVNGASFTGSLAPGGMISIFGDGLSSRTLLASDLPWPTAIDGSSVTVNGAPLPLYFVSPNQINAQLPFDQQGPAILRVTTASGSVQTAVTISETAPAIFPNAIQHANGILVSDGSPARPGETLVVYATGLGQVDNSGIEAGQAPPASPLAHSIAPVTVQIGGSAPITPFFAGLTPGFPGLYQVNVTLPLDLVTTVYPLRLMSRGIASNASNVQVAAQNR